MSGRDKKKMLHFLVLAIGLPVVSIFSLGCEGGSAARQDSRALKSPNSEESSPAISGDESSALQARVPDEPSAPQEKAESKPKDSSRREKFDTAHHIGMGKNVWLAIQGDKREVVVQAEVCLREGMLEHLMCRKRTKEHEAILAADVDARDIHKALILAKATPGSTVKYKEDGTVIPPTGTKIKITLRYKDKDKQVTVPGRDWVQDMKTKKSLEHDWVFA